MKTNNKYYKSSDLADMFELHPNTVRLYEQLGYLSPAGRGDNNYRRFTELHVLQMKICRHIFGYPFTSRRIRDAGNEVMWASGRKQWDMGKQNAYHYIATIRRECELARDTAQILQQWASMADTINTGVNDRPLPAQSEGSHRLFRQESEHERCLSRREAAEWLGITVETVRNWERNQLLSSDTTGNNGEVLYRGRDLERLSVVYMLRQSGYSVAAIHQSITMFDRGKADKVLSALHEPRQDDLISVGDRWLHELNRLLLAAEKIPGFFDEMALLAQNRFA